VRNDKFSNSIIAFYVKNEGQENSFDRKICRKESFYCKQLNRNLEFNSVTFEKKIF